VGFKVSVNEGSAQVPLNRETALPGWFP
jgi:hypothetical protein